MRRGLRVYVLFVSVAFGLLILRIAAINLTGIGPVVNWLEGERMRPLTIGYNQPEKWFDFGRYEVRMELTGPWSGRGHEIAFYRDSDRWQVLPMPLAVNETQYWQAQPGPGFGTDGVNRAVWRGVDAVRVVVDRPGHRLAALYQGQRFCSYDVRTGRVRARYDVTHVEWVLRGWAVLGLLAVALARRRRLGHGWRTAGATLWLSGLVGTLAFVQAQVW